MTYSTADYSEIDPILNRWAIAKGLAWVREDRGWDVRTLYWPLEQTESVQLWLPEPLNGKVTIHVCQNTSSGGLHNRNWRVPVSDLNSALDEALDTALSLVAKLKRPDDASN